MAARRVLAVLVTHNGKQWLGESLGALAAQDYPALDVVVVDNGSDGSAEPSVRQLLPWAEFVRLERNVGFGAAANHALEVSSSAPGADCFVFLHDDVAMDPDCVRRLVEAASETEAGIVGGKAVAWDRPEVLVEVGMAADQFGYPFSGLEDGEIDQGQHDVRRDVLFVTSACILASRSMVERCGSWDGGYFAFGEDLDLCMRARLSGFRVVVQPAARFRHAVALANRQRDAEPANAIRFYTRRNRPRTIAKNAAGHRVWAVLFLYTVLATAEMVMLATLRRFDEIPAYPKAFLSFLASVPDVLRRRRAVQKRRTVSDRRMRRYMVRDLHRGRVFFERRLSEWGSGTLELGARTFARLSPVALRATLRAWVRRPATAAIAGVALALVVALHGVLFGDVLGGGGLWPYPESVGRLLGEYLAGWRDVGLGTSAAAPAAFPLLWLAGALALGKAWLAQKVLVVGLVAAGLIGLNRSIGRRTAFVPARVFAVVIYAAGPVVALAVGTGDLGALALYAGLPYIVEIVQRMLVSTPGRDEERAPTPLTANEMARDGLRLALIAAGVVALAPSAYPALGLLCLLAGLHSLGAVWHWGERLRRMLWVAASIGLAGLLLVPWSLEAARPEGAILAPLFSGLGGGERFRAQWSGQGFSSMFLLNPGAGVPATVVAVAVAAGALALSSGARRRECDRLVLLWFAFALAGGLVAKGWAPAPSASAAMWLTVPLVSLAMLGVHMAAGLREELPRHALGWRHGLALGLLLAVSAGVLAGWLPRLGAWGRTSSTLAADTGDAVSGPISSFFESTATQKGEFRILWMGEGLLGPVRAGVRSSAGTPFVVTRPEGLTMLDAFRSSPTAGERRVEEVVDALLGRRLHLAGHLLAPAGIRFIVVDPADDRMMAAMAGQRDIALRQQQTELAIFETLEPLPRAAFAPEPLIPVASAEAPDDRALMQVDWGGAAALPRESLTGFRAELDGRTTAPGLILLGDNFNSGWRATAGGERLRHAEAFGWSNAFVLPAGARGAVGIGYARDWVRGVWVTLQAGMVAIAIAMARVRTRELEGLLR